MAADIELTPSTVVPPVADFTSERFATLMDQTAVFLLSRGFFTAFWGYSKWTATYLRWLAGHQVVSFDVVPIPQLPKVRVRISTTQTDAEGLSLCLQYIVNSHVLRTRTMPVPDGRSGVRVFRLMAAVRVFEAVMSASSVVLLAPFRALLFSLVFVIRSSLRSLPPLLATVVIVFVTGDAWRILAATYGWRYWALTGFFLVASGGAGLVALAGSGIVDNAAEAAAAYKSTKFLGRSRLDSKLVELRLAATGELHKGDRATIRAALTVTALLQVVGVGALTALALVVVGAIRLDVTATNNLLTGTAAKAVVLWHLPWGMVITRQLMMVSTSLGAFSSLYFAAVGLADNETRDGFIASNSKIVRRSVRMIRLYRNAQMQLRHLETGGSTSADGTANPDAKTPTDSTGGAAAATSTLTGAQPGV